VSTIKQTVMLVSRGVAIACLVTPLVAAAQTSERGRTEGLKETDRFIKAGNATTESVTEAKEEVQKTLTNYNTLVTQPSKNMQSDYKKLLKSVDSMNKKVNEATEKLGAMQTAGDTYFQGRKTTIKDIQDPSLQKQAEQRMAQNQKEFAGVLASLREARDALEPFRKQLADQITYLGSDLNPSATASLKPEAQKLNAEGGRVFAKADQAIAKANDYFNGLSAAQS
jgi:phosphoenolpyruvate-protein kinase (PTS system EI component)